MFQVYKVGDKVLPPSWYEYLGMSLSDAGGTIAVVYKNIAEAELKAFNSGFKFKVVVVDGIVWMLVKVGNQPWADIPYYKYAEDRLPTFEMPSDGMGLAMQMLLVEANTGILKAIRMVGLPTDVSRKLIKAVENQPYMPDYTQRRNKQMDKYKTTDLVRLADQNE